MLFVGTSHRCQNNTFQSKASVKVSIHVPYVCQSHYDVIWRPRVRTILVIVGYHVIKTETYGPMIPEKGYVHFTERVGTETQVVGDDLLVTNPTRIQTGIDKKACNALLLKVNQIGTLTESIQAAKMSLKEGWGVMVSHRSGIFIGSDGEFETFLARNLHFMIQI